MARDGGYGMSHKYCECHIPKLDTLTKAPHVIACALCGGWKVVTITTLAELESAYRMFKRDNTIKGPT